MFVALYGIIKIIFKVREIRRSNPQITTNNKIMAFHAAVLLLELLSTLNWVRFDSIGPLNEFGKSASFQVVVDSAVQWMICYICWTLGSSAQLREYQFCRSP